MATAAEWNLMLADFLEFKGPIQQNPAKKQIQKNWCHVVNILPEFILRQWLLFGIAQMSNEPRRMYNKQSIPVEMRKNYILVIEKVCSFSFFLVLLPTLFILCCLVAYIVIFITAQI